MSAVLVPDRRANTVAAIERLVGDADLEFAARAALKWLETYSPPWTAVFEIAALRAALKVKS